MDSITSIETSRTWASWWLTVVLVGLVSAGAALFLHLNFLIESGERRYQSYLFADELRQSSDDLTRMVRTFVATQDQRFIEQFHQVLAIRNGEQPRPQNYNQIYWDFFAVTDNLPEKEGDKRSLRDLMVTYGIADDELMLLQRAQSESDALVTLEEIAIRAVSNRLTAEDEQYRIADETNQEMAMRLLHGMEYHQAKLRIMEPIQAFLTKLTQRTENEFQTYAENTKSLIALCFVLVIMASVIALKATLLARRISVSKQETLENALESERKYSDLQQQFVSLVSHEFRTPLTIIDGNAQRLIRRKDDATPEQLLQRGNVIRSAVERMTELIDSTLYASRLDAGKIKIDLQPCNLTFLVSDVCGHITEISPDHDIHIDMHGVPDTIIADSKLLEHIFTNLLSNAVKFSPDDTRIEIEGRMEDASVSIKVRDFGIGISEDDLPHMFERYFRANSAKGIKGTGLGLNVSERFAKMHGGTIVVDSIEGEGSTFTVRLPINVEDQSL